jgi:hypothetical protein
MSEERDIPELQREQLALGELSAARREALLQRPDTEARLAALRASNAEILAAHPPAVVIAELRRRAARHRADRRVPARALWLVPTFAAAAVAAFVMWPAEDVPRDSLIASRVRPPEPGETRIKGLEPHLLVHRQEGERAVLLAEQARARAHDRLQLSVVAAGARHGVVLSIDGNGVVTLHAPGSAAEPTALQQDGAVALPRSYELDAAPGFERFILVTADEPLDVTRIEQAARAVAGAADAASKPLALPEGWRQRSFLVEKVTP